MGERVVVEVELHSGDSFQQVDIHFSIILHKLKLALLHFLYKFCKHVQVTDKDQVARESEEDETEVKTIKTTFLFLL